jgi:hypothetical protein
MKLKKKLTSLYRVVGDWIRSRDLGIVWIVLIILGVLAVVTLLVGLALGVVLGIPALFLYLAWNWVIPVFGGPFIGYWTAVGLTILAGIVTGMLSRCRK